MRRSTRATVKSATRLAPARLRARAHAVAVDPVVITSSINRMRCPATLRERNAAATLRRRALLLEPACVGVACTRRSARTTGMPVLREIPRGQQFGLVESSLQAAPPVERHRDDRIETFIARQGSRQQAAERARQRANPAVLEEMDQLAQRALVSSERVSRVKTAKAAAARERSGLRHPGGTRFETASGN